MVVDCRANSLIRFVRADMCAQAAKHKNVLMIKKKRAMIEIQSYVPT